MPSALGIERYSLIVYKLHIVTFIEWGLPVIMT